MGKNWAKTGAKVTLLTAGLIVIGSGAAYGDPIDAGQVTGVVGQVTGAVQQITGQGVTVPAPLAKRHLDEPKPVLPGAPVQSSAIDTAPALSAVAAAQKNLAEHAPGGKAAMDGVDKAATTVKDATGSAPAPLAKKRGPIPGVGNAKISVPPNADNPGDLGTPLDQVGDPANAVGGAVESVTSAIGQPGLASK